MTTTPETSIIRYDNRHGRLEVDAADGNTYIIWTEPARRLERDPGQGDFDGIGHTFRYRTKDRPKSGRGVVGDPQGLTRVRLS